MTETSVAGQFVKFRSAVNSYDLSQEDEFHALYDKCATWEHREDSSILVSKAGLGYYLFRDGSRCYCLYADGEGGEENYGDSVGHYSELACRIKTRLESANRSATTWPRWKKL